jgi:hypothetical protein
LPAASDAHSPTSGHADRTFVAYRAGATALGKAPATARGSPRRTPGAAHSLQGDHTTHNGPLICGSADQVRPRPDADEASTHWRLWSKVFTASHTATGTAEYSFIRPAGTGPPSVARPAGAGAASTRTLVWARRSGPKRGRARQERRSGSGARQSNLTASRAATILTRGRSGTRRLRKDAPATPLEAPARWSCIPRRGMPRVTFTPIACWAASHTLAWRPGEMRWSGWEFIPNRRGTEPRRSVPKRHAQKSGILAGVISGCGSWFASIQPENAVASRRGSTTKPHARGVTSARHALTRWLADSGGTVDGRRWGSRGRAARQTASVVALDVRLRLVRDGLVGALSTASPACRLSPWLRAEPAQHQGAYSMVAAGGARTALPPSRAEFAPLGCRRTAIRSGIGLELRQPGRRCVVRGAATWRCTAIKPPATRRGSTPATRFRSRLAANLAAVWLPASSGRAGHDHVAPERARFRARPSRVAVWLAVMPRDASALPTGPGRRYESRPRADGNVVAIHDRRT